VKKSQSILALSVLSITIISLFATAFASSGAGVLWVSRDPHDPPPDPSAPPLVFLLGDTVYINWTDYALQALVEVEHDDTGAVVKRFTIGGSGNEDGMESFLPKETGTYVVWVGYVDVCRLDVTTFFVVPEVVFGSLGAVGAASAAGLLHYRRKRR